MTRTFPALGFDPAPGELSAVQAVLVALADAVNTIAATLPRLEEACEITDDADWGGSAAEEFSDHGDDLPLALGTGIEAMGTVSDALAGWATRLKANQDTAEELEQTARQLTQQLAHAEDALTAAASAIPHDTGHPDHARRQAAYLDQVDRTAKLDTALDAVVERARRLQARHLREADAAGEGIRGGPDDAFRPENDSWYVQTLDGVARVSGIVSAATAAAAAGLALTGVGAPAAAVLTTVSAGTAGVSTIAGIGQRVAGSSNAPSDVALALSVVPGRTFTSAAVGAGRGLLRPTVGTGRLRGAATGARSGAVEGFTSGGLPNVVTNVRETHRLGLRAKIATDGVNQVSKSDAQLAGEAFANTVDAGTRTVEATGGTIGAGHSRGLELLKLAANPRSDAAQNAVVNLTRDELSR